MYTSFCTLKVSLVVIVFSNVTPVWRGERSVKTVGRSPFAQASSRSRPIEASDARNMETEANVQAMFSSRRFIVMAAFVAAIAAVIVLNLRGAGGGASASETIQLREVAHASGIDFVHQSPTLDPKVAHIAAHIGALGACVSVADVK